MCGICGVIQVEGDPHPPIDQRSLDRMTDTMVHRGPDERGTHLQDGIALGARRLSVVDVRDGHQPVSNESGTVWSIQNGEIYNHADLRRGLEASGHRFRSRCDTEVLPHLYERYGLSFPSRLRGMFGIATWDAANRRAVIVRDRLGIKPLYYAHVGGAIVFASELKSVLASGLVDPELDYEGIDAYLTLGFFPGPRTPLRDVKKLEPGTLLAVEGGDVAIERYWGYPEPAVASGRTVSQYVEELRDLLEESVRMRLMADVPLGAMLSGGLDSSVIVGLMAKHSSGSLKTFSVGFEEDPASELDAAREVARQFGTDHHELELSVKSSDVDLADLIWHMDEPVADLSAVGFQALCALAREHVTVALSGQGADELFAGYRKHVATAVVSALSRLPGETSRSLGRMLERGPSRARRFGAALAAPGGAERLLASSSRVPRSLRSRLARGPLAELNGSAGLTAASARLASTTGDPLAENLFLDAQLGLVDDMLHYFDRSSMAVSLEVRVPFLDHHLVEFAAGVPSSLKVKNARTTKYLLKRAARGLVPDEVIHRKKVGFFNATVPLWMDQQARGATGDYLLGDSLRTSNFLDSDEIRRIASSRGGSVDRRRDDALLTILMLEVWLSEFLPRAMKQARG